MNLREMNRQTKLDITVKEQIEIAEGSSGAFELEARIIWRENV